MRIAESLKGILSRFCGFSLVGAFNTLASMIIVLVMNEVMGVNYMLSYITAYVVTLFAAYVINAKAVFKTPISSRGALAFFGAYLSGMIVGTIALRVLTGLLPDANSTLLSYSVIPLTMIWNFIWVNKFSMRGFKKGGPYVS